MNTGSCRLLLAGLFLCIISMQAKAQKTFRIIADLKGVKNSNVYLQYSIGEERIIDSLKTSDGKFVFTGKYAEPVRATMHVVPLDAAGNPVRVPYEQEDMGQFFIDAVKVYISGSAFKSSKIKGGKAEVEFLKLDEMKKSIREKQKPLQKAASELYRSGGDETELASIQQKQRTLHHEEMQIEEEFIKKHPDSYVSLYILADRAAIIDPVTFEPLFSMLSPAIKSSLMGKRLDNHLQLAKKTTIGRPAMDFTLNNTNGNAVSLSSFKGKYVLIDFWASWCGPCRAESPHLVKAYEKYNSKGFEIIGVSLDDKKELWLNAIKKDDLTWINLSDLKGWKSAVAKEYGITALPQNLLLDMQGIIIAKNVRGEELERKLEEVLD